MEVIHHPQVQWIWNYFPFSLVFITPVREVLNVFTLETNRLVLFIPQFLWNSVPETGVVALTMTMAMIAFYDFLVFFKPEIDGHQKKKDLTSKEWDA